jgi:hypothetical protein
MDLVPDLVRLSATIDASVLYVSIRDQEQAM